MKLIRTNIFHQTKNRINTALSTSQRKQFGNMLKTEVGNQTYGIFLNMLINDSTGPFFTEIKKLGFIKGLR